ncbi:Histone-lysine N-methyltransferase [Chlorella vulgaris]
MRRQMLGASQLFRLPGSWAGSTRWMTMTAAVPSTLEEQLANAPWLQLLQVPSAGRGLFAATDIEQGMLLIEEAPLLAAPSPHAMDCTCHHCLRPLASSSGSTSGSKGTSSLRFCSPSCGAAARQAWAVAAERCSFGALQQACRERAEKFPLMAAQLACIQVQRHLGLGSSSSSSNSSGANPLAAATAAVAEAEGPAMGDPVTQLRHLCFANMPDVPQPWTELHQLLLQGLRPLSAGFKPGGDVSSSSSSSGSGSESVSPEWLEQQFGIEWYCDTLARLHLNSFRVDTMPVHLDPSDPSALLKAAMAHLSDAGSASHRTGSAAYLLASMLNHSCEPCLDVTFPGNNAVASFSAARDIARGEELTICYLDGGQGLAARQAALSWGYGFTCRCPRCVEEGGAEAGSSHQ